MALPSLSFDMPHVSHADVAEAALLAHFAVGSEEARLVTFSCQSNSL